MLVGQDGKNLAVDADVCNLEHVDELGVGEANFANRGVDLDSPKVTEGALLGTAVAESVDTSLEHCRTSETNLALASPFEALHASEKVLSTFCMLCTSFDAWHRRLGKVVRHHRFQCATDGDAECDVGALIARNIPTFARIEVALASFSLEHLAGSRDSDTLAHRLVCFHCHIVVLRFAKVSGKRLFGQVRLGKKLGLTCQNHMHSAVHSL